MSNPPVGKSVPCPGCSATVTAIVPKGSAIVETEANADGKVNVRCKRCEERFVVYYRR